MQFITQQTTGLEDRLDKQDATLRQMAEVLNEQKHLATTIDNVTIALNETKREVREVVKRVELLELAPAKKTYEVMKKTLWIVIPVILTAFVGMLLSRIGIK